MECKKDNLSDKSETEESQRVSVDAKCCMRYNEVIARCMAESRNRSLKENGGNNMAGKKNILTYEGLNALEDELQDLKVNKRKEVAVKIKEAREQGDLSENAEYDAAKDEQRDIEIRIEEIDNILKNAEVVVEDDIDVNVVNVGSKVKIKDLEFPDEEPEEYKIVGSTEADCLNGKISNESPVGVALIGSKVGDVVTVESNTGDIIKYEVLEIQRAVI